MSEMTTAILIHRQDLTELETWIRSKKKQAYLLPVTSEWTGLLIEKDLQTADKWAGKVSAGLNKPVLFFGNYDEFGWKADFWENGERQALLDLTFERPRRAKVEIEENANWSRYAAQPRVLESLIERLTAEGKAKMDPDLVERFKEAFGLESLSFLSYDYVDSDSPESWEERGIREVSSTKRPRMKRVIREFFEEPLSERGYTWVPESGGTDYMVNQYAFQKNMGSYAYRIRIENWEKNKIQLSYTVPYFPPTVELYLRDNGYYEEFTFDGDTELKKVLQNVLEAILKKGIPWLESEEQRMEDFDLQEVYREVLDPIMAVRGFERRVDPNSNLNPAFDFVYSDLEGKWRILFAHSKDMAHSWMSVRRFNETLSNPIMYEEKNAPQPLSQFFYQSREELIQQLTGAAGGFFRRIDQENLLTYDPYLTARIF